MELETATQKSAYQNDTGALYVGAKQLLVLTVILLLIQLTGVLSQVHNRTQIHQSQWRRLYVAM